MPSDISLLNGSYCEAIMPLCFKFRVWFESYVSKSLTNRILLVVCGTDRKETQGFTFWIIRKSMKINDYNP